MAWIARNKSGFLYIHENKPLRRDNDWSSEKGKMNCVTGYFDIVFLHKRINWEDEPVEIEIKEKL